MTLFDIFIPCKTSDVNKLKFLLPSIRKNIAGYDDIFIVTPERIDIPGVKCLTDFEVLPKWYKDTAPYRPGWTFQQYLKILQPVSKDRYLIIDSDLWINRPLEIFDSAGKPTFFFGRDQLAPQYFEHMSHFGLRKFHHYSFISEIMLFDRSIISEFLADQKLTADTFVEKSNKILTRTCHIGDYEFYGNMVMKYRKDAYNEKYLKSLVLGKHGPWSDHEITVTIKDPMNSSYDTIAYHTWEG